MHISECASCWAEDLPSLPIPSDWDDGAGVGIAGPLKIDDCLGIYAFLDGDSTITFGLICMTGEDDTESRA